MCKLIRFIYLVIPIHGFRVLLIRKHFEICSSCQKDWGMDQSMQQFFTEPKWIKEEKSLWPQIQRKILTAEKSESRHRRKKAFLFPRWQWTAAGLAILILVGISFLLRNKGTLEPAQEKLSSVLKNPAVHIVHAEINGNKATPFIYQTSENLYIWFDESHQEEE
jgi:hypothetical protein